ncbi:MAG: hypothetical protein WCL18_05335 [bacterium]
MINIPNPIRAYFKSNNARNCFPMVVYNAKTEKIIDLVVAIAIPLLNHTNTWFHAGIRNHSKKLNSIIITVIVIHDFRHIHAMMRRIACAIVENTRA